MSAFQAIGAAAAGLLASAVAVGWAVKPRTAGRHRAVPLLVPLDDLLGPRSPYTEFEHAPAAIRPAFGYCPTCRLETAGSLNKDGWLCGECLTPTGGAR